MSERNPGTAVAEIGLAVCDLCGHRRSEHVFCSDLYPALCVHPEPADKDWGCCTCLDFVNNQGREE
jgi:hypothetical protein